jgi:hypothetical protein
MLRSLFELIDSYNYLTGDFMVNRRYVQNNAAITTIGHFDEFLARQQEKYEL